MSYRGRSRGSESSDWDRGHNNRGRNNQGYRGGRRGFRGRGRGSYSAIPLLQDGGDADMLDSGRAPASRYNPYGNRPRQQDYSRRGNQRGPRDNSRSFGRGNMRRLGLPIHEQNYSNRNRYVADDEEFYKIEVRQGAALDQTDLTTQIQSYCNTPFTPLNYKVIADDVVFNVIGRRMADTIKRANNKIILPNGRRVVVIVTHDKNSATKSLTEDQIQKLTVCMSNRYDTTVQALNIASLYYDEDLKKENCRLSLSKQNVMEEVVKIIQTHIPEVKSINLSNNNIRTLRSFAQLAANTPGIFKLNISDNKLATIEEMSLLNDWKLTELDVKNNDFCKRYRDEHECASAVRKYLSTLTIIDGIELPPQITFDLDTTVSLPPTLGSAFGSDQVKEVLLKFLHQYYEIYDSDTRQSLLDAYHADAVFSWNWCFNNLRTGKLPRWGDLTESRNLLIVQDPVRRQKNLKRGKLQIVATLTSFPSTQHDNNSFIMSVMFESSDVIVFSLSGLFKDGDSKSDNSPIFGFSRVFVTIPKGSGIVITNDLLTVYNASTEQTKMAFRNPAPTPASSPTPTTSITSTLAQSPPALNEKQMILLKFCEASGMNEEWSTKCLVQNDWNFEKAGQIFQELQASGSIPAEAFIR